LFTFLRTGVTSLHGATGATMTPVIRGALALPVVPDSDIRAIALYFSGINRANARASTRANDVDATTRQAVATSYVSSDQAENDPDAGRRSAKSRRCS
jgi:hypothetical protein